MVDESTNVDEDFNGRLITQKAPWQSRLYSLKHSNRYKKIILRSSQLKAMRIQNQLLTQKNEAFNNKVNITLNIRPKIKITTINKIPCNNYSPNRNVDKINSTIKKIKANQKKEYMSLKQSNSTNYRRDNDPYMKSKNSRKFINSGSNYFANINPLPKSISVRKIINPESQINNEMIRRYFGTIGNSYKIGRAHV